MLKSNVCVGSLFKKRRVLWFFSRQFTKIKLLKKCSQSFNNLNLYINKKKRHKSTYQYINTIKKKTKTNMC